MLLGAFPTAFSDKGWKLSKLVNASNSLQVQQLPQPPLEPSARSTLCFCWVAQTFL